jgi:hypothetical protein
MAGIFSLSALATVYALNPFFWPEWKEIHATEVRHEMRVMAQGGAVSGVLHANGQYPELRKLAQPLELPRLFLRWDDLMRGQQSIAEWKHNRLLDIHARLFSYRLNAPGEFIFVAAGLVALLWKKCAKYAPEYDGSRAVLIFFLFANYLFILLFIRLNWIRYYLPTMAAAHPIAAVGVYATIANAYQSVSKFVGSAVAARTGANPIQ